MSAAAPGAAPCPGPLVWFDVPADDRFPDAALLLCARPDCGYLVVSGGFNDAAHAEAPLLREGV